jgi:hypothetical protein
VKKVLLPLFSLLLLLCTASAFAGTEHDWWIDNFGVQIPLVSPLTSLDLLIASPGTDTCSPVRKQILSGLGDYAEAASIGKGGKAKGIADHVMKLVDFAGATNCANEELKTYVLGSYFISFPDIIHESAHWLEAGGARQYNSFLQDFRTNGNISVEFRNVLVLALLIHQDRLQLLTPSMRKVLGGDWNTGEVFGAYDCNSRILSIDPTMRPFDLGATLQHEMDHFMRDQFFSGEKILENFSSESFMDIFKARTLPSPDQINWEAYLTLDEAIASIEASMMQREQINDQGMPDFNMKKNNMVIKVNGLYLADDDFTFRVSSGPMEKLFQLGNLHDPVMDLEQIHYHDTFSFGYSDQQAIKDQKKPAAFQVIFDLIHSGYFAGAVLNDQIKAILARAAPLDIDPLNSDTIALMDAPVGYTFETDNEFVKSMYQGISAVAARLPKVSSACTLYDQAVQSGKVSGYAGLRFGEKENSDGDGQPGENGSRTGENGSRTGENGSRTGENDGRPGENGSRTGENGARPSLSVRPCLSFGRKL